jgi:N-acetylneuraminic acid mutarotase
MTLLLAGCLAAAAQDVGVFTSTGSLITARVYHTTTLLANGQVLVAGGQDNNSYLGYAELYDPATGYWIPTGSLNNAREYQTATRLANGQVLVVGGEDWIYGLLSSAELYDPATGAWSYTGDLNSQRFVHTAILLPSGQVLVVGGYAGYGVEGGQNVYGDHTSVELYDPTTGTWSFTGDIDQERDSPTATLLANGKVLLAGGDDKNGPLASVELYDPATGRWTRTGSLGTARDGDTVTLLPNGKVLVAGGDDTNNDYLTSAELYDPATGSWTPTGSLNEERAWHTATLLPNGKVLVAGGDDNGNSAELFDPATANWTRTGSLGTARDSHTATLLPNGQVLIAGGYDYDDGNPSASVELYDPALSFLNPTFNNPIILGDGSFQFGFINASGPSYSVLASPDAGAPMNSWLNLGAATEMPVGSGLFQFTDPQAPNYPQRFYRVSSP